MRMKELQEMYLKARIDKKVYWTLMRENYTHVLPEIMELLHDNDECKSIAISGDDIVLEKQSGIKLYFNFEEAMSRAEIDLCNASDPEKEDMRIVADLIDKRGANVAFDIGANVGMFSMELLKKLPNMEFYAFEPIPSTFSNLLRTIKLNDICEERIHPYNMGMSDKKGVFKFYLPGESEAASLQPIDDMFYRRVNDKYGNFTGTVSMNEIECQVGRVDDFVIENNIDDLCFIKIDVEGNEKFVLEGAGDTLKRFHPIVYCELLRKHAKRFGYHPNDVITFMRKIGYTCNTVRDKELIAIESIEEDTIETNFIFL